MFLGTATILIIDDKEIIRVLLRSALEAAGYEVTEAANGRQGLERYRHRQTVLITDIVMPELNGLDMPLELAREFLEAKVIALSGAVGEKNVLDVAKLLGVRQTFQKPFSMPPLLGAVRYELEHEQDAEKVGQRLHVLRFTRYGSLMLADFISILLIPLDQALHGV